jgi:hypothetical protein
MTDIYVAVIGTEPWENSYSGDTNLYDIMNLASSVWDTYISDGSGDYSLWIDTISDRVPKSAIECDEDDCSNFDMRDRANKIDDWCQNNIIYDYRDVIMVADYFGDGDKTGVAQQTAATNKNKVAMEDYAKSLAPEWDNNLGHKGVNVHELLHMFLDVANSSEHFPSVTYNYETTLMYSPDEVDSWCLKYTYITNVQDVVSDCTQSKVRNWIDNNL